MPFCLRFVLKPNLNSSALTGVLFEKTINKREREREREREISKCFIIVTVFSVTLCDRDRHRCFSHDLKVNGNIFRGNNSTIVFDIRWYFQSSVLCLRLLVAYLLHRRRKI